MDFDSVKIYKTFSKEWFSNYTRQPDWEVFINSKDLGIVCIKNSDSAKTDEYELVDPKKWVLAKIKYGF